ncbi:actin family, partial [Globomyces pollinis-pini]
MVRFGGEEVNALVFDFGSSLSKVGYAGEDSPKTVLPSYVGQVNDPSNTKTKVLGINQIYKSRQNMEIISPFDHDGLVNNWEVFENLWDYTYSDILRVESKDHPLMFANRSWDTKANREKLCELAFEKYDTPGFYLGRSAVLSAFAAGRATALVIDSGASTTSVVPVFDGYVVKKAVQKAPVGGNYVSHQVKQYLRHMNVDLTPQCLIDQRLPVDTAQPPQFQRKDFTGITSSFVDFSIERTIHDFKETICNVSEITFNERDLKRRPGKTFEFPTGFNATFGIDRFRIVESLFQPGFLLNATLPQSVTIPQLIAASIGACDAELQTILHTNAVLSGGGTLMPGFSDRVFHELQRASPGGRIKIQAAGSASDRKFGPWIGGSILASLGSFHQLWISKSQYEEIGSGVEKRIH